MISYVFPGQGSQSIGMGKEYFDEFKDLVDVADEILGYSIKDLCLNDPDKKLNFTQYTQPALYTVNALAYLKTVQETGVRPDVVAGHSLGEYDALFAAGVFDFATGLKLVKKRGELMGQAENGGMAAVLGMDEQAVKEVIKKNNLESIDIANLNSPAQTVISGVKEDIENSVKFFEEAGARRVVILNVSGAFHSRYMEPARKEFEEYMKQFQFNEPEIMVMSNVYGRPYQNHILRETLSKQITSSVRWTDIIRYMWGMDNDGEIIQIGPGRVLTDLTTKIKRSSSPFDVEALKREEASVSNSVVENDSPNDDVVVNNLGSSEFKKEYGLKYSYVVGPMESGITTNEMVKRSAEAGLLGIFGTYNLSAEKIENEINRLKSSLKNKVFAVAVSPEWSNPEWEEKIVDILCRCDVKAAQFSNYINVTKAILKYKAKGIVIGKDGELKCENRIIAKLSRPEVAAVFVQPASDALIDELLESGDITNQQAEYLKTIPVADDICVESNSAGRTDSASVLATFPAICRLVGEISEKFGYSRRIRIGCSGSIGSPEAAAALFSLGADFIMTGSINQCTVESGTSTTVKKMLQDTDIQDTEYIPSCDNFDYNAKMQVLKKGVLFPVRANKLYYVYKVYDSIEAIPVSLKKQIEEHYLKHTFEEVYDIIKGSLNDVQLKRVNKLPKYKMALVFRWYYQNSMKNAVEGNETDIVNSLIYTSVAMGAFNAYVKNTEFEKWENRHVDEIGIMIMKDAEKILNNTLEVGRRAGQ